MPFQAMRLRANSAAVSFVAASGANYIASGTSINSPSTPAGIQNGDGLFAIIYARSAFTPPVGWTLVASQSNSNPSSGVTQTIFIYRKDAVTSSDASTAFTWSQAVAGRMGLAYVVVRSSSGAITVAETASVETDYAVSTPYPQNVQVPTLAATSDGELFLIAATAELGNSIVSDGVWTAPAGATLRTISPQAENRLAAATQARNAGQSNSTPMTMGAGTTTATANYYSAVTVRLQA